MRSRVLDLFCGCGGLSLGFQEAGFDIKYGIDNSINALESFELNHKNAKGVNANLSTAVVKDLINSNGIKNIDLIIGGPPCQGYSIAGKRIINDERNKMYKTFLEFVKELLPTSFLMENVPNILSMGNGIIKSTIIDDFSKIGYQVKYDKLLAADYGVPQNRRRAFFFGTKGNNNFIFPKKIQSMPVVSKDAISDLPDFELDNGSEYPFDAKSSYQKQMRKKSKGIYNHQLTEHHKRTIDTISLVPDGGNYKDLPDRLKNSRRVNIAWTRLNSKKPSFTIDTGHRHHFHYKYNRVPTVRESARLQSFPDNFIFSGSKTNQYVQVGNAVPPLMARKIAEAIKEYLNV
jgi:DNA (cytosine-5)-methyltransferase 1